VTFTPGSCSPRRHARAMNSVPKVHETTNLALDAEFVRWRDHRSSGSRSGRHQRNRSKASRVSIKDGGLLFSCPAPSPSSPCWPVSPSPSMYRHPQSRLSAPQCHPLPKANDILGWRFHFAHRRSPLLSDMVFCLTAIETVRCCSDLHIHIVSGTFFSTFRLSRLRGCLQRLDLPQHRLRDCLGGDVSRPLTK
jgi:hypothetical protein